LRTCRHALPGPGPDTSEIRMCPAHCSARSAPPLSVNGRWPRATGLASYPSSCVLISFGRRPFRRLPLVSDLIAFPRSSPGLSSRRLPFGSLNPRRPVSLFPSRLRHRQVSAAFLGSFRTAGRRTTTLAHSSNYRLFTDCVRPMSRNPGTRGVTRIRGWFADPHHLFLVSRAEAAHLLASWSLRAGRNDPSRGSR
jgi:hypothetical protein